MDFLIEALAWPVEGPIAAKYLGELNAREAIPHLRPLLASESWFMRAAAARSLGQLRDDDAVSGLEHLALRDPDVPVRANAIIAVSRISERGAIHALNQAARDPALRVRNSAAIALGEFGDMRDISTLEDARSAAPWWSRGMYRKAIRRVRRRG